MTEEKIIRFLKNEVEGKHRYFSFESHPYLHKCGLSYIGDRFYSIHDKEIELNDYSNYLPNTLMPSVPLNYNLNENVYNQYIHNISANIYLVIQIHVGSISGVNYGRGVEIMVGIHYFGTMIRIYHYKTSGNLFDLKGIVDENFFKLIDFKNFKLVKNWEGYLSEFSEFEFIPNKVNFTKLFELCIVDNAFYWHSSISDVFGLVDHDIDNYEFRKLKKLKKNAFKNLKFETLVIKSICNYLNLFKLPSTCKEIIFDIEEDINPNNLYSPTKREILIDCIEHLLPYTHLFKDTSLTKIVDKINIRNEFNHKLNSLIELTFNYKGVNGKVYTNELCYDRMINFYSTKKYVVLNIMDNEFKIYTKDFLAAVTVKKIKNYNKIIKQLKSKYTGVTSWWLKDFEKKLRYKEIK